MCQVDPSSTDYTVQSVQMLRIATLQFEASWSDQARLAQRQPGYEWTKTFKATVQICGGMTYTLWRGIQHGTTWYIWSMVPAWSRHCGSRWAMLVMQVMYIVVSFFRMQEIRSTENSTKHIMRGRRRHDAPCKRRGLWLQFCSGKYRELFMTQKKPWRGYPA